MKQKKQKTEEKRFQESVWTIEKEKDNNALFIKMKYYPWSLIPMILWLSIVFGLYFHLSEYFTFIQKSISIFVLIWSSINVCVCLGSNHSDEIEKYKPHFFWMQVFVSFSVIITASIVVDWKYSGNYFNMAWLLVLIFLCTVSIISSRRQRSGIKNINDGIRRLININVIAVFIALMQLVIAFPQLKQAYKSATSDDIKELMDQQKKLFENVQQFAMVSIPDSLQNDEVKMARMSQTTLYMTAVGLSHVPFAEKEIFDFQSNEKEERTAKIKFLKQEFELERVRLNFWLDAVTTCNMIIRFYGDSTKYPEISNLFSETVILTKLNQTENLMSIYGEQLKRYSNYNNSLKKIVKQPIEKQSAELIDERVGMYFSVVDMKTKKQISENINDLMYYVINALNYVQLYYAYKECVALKILGQAYSFSIAQQHNKDNPLSKQK